MTANRLLIVDDEPAIGAFIGRIAANAGYEILAVSTADKFLDHVRAWRPTHIMLDLQMPVADGLALLSHLAADGCKATIILISGADRSVVQAAQKVGLQRGLKVSHALTKPFRAGELVAMLDQVKQEESWLSVAALSKAMADGQFHLAYQPQIDLHSGAFTGVEALLRWQHPARGAIAPIEFIPVAESSPFIDRLTHWVSSTACEQARAWEAVGLALEVALNVSARNLHEARLADLLESHCAAAGIGPGRVILELTETAAMQDAVQVMDVLTRLRLKGFKLAIDDFGTGYSSLVQLHRLPFNEIKIDRAFVADCARSGESRSIVRMIIDLAHALGMTTVAEGVEDMAALELLRALGCDAAQGYFIARPAGGDALPELGRTLEDATWARALRAKRAVQSA